MSSGQQGPGEGCRLLHRSTSPLSGECSASVIWGCPHTQGVNVGALFSRRVAACIVCSVMPGLHLAALGLVCGVCIPSAYSGFCLVGITVCLLGERWA